MGARLDHLGGTLGARVLKHINPAPPEPKPARRVRPAGSCGGGR
jgi:hypothetical protein